MRWRLPFLVALLLIQLPVSATTCADLVAPVISGRALGAQIRALALAEAETENDKHASLIAGRLLEVIGTEIQSPDPYFFLDDSSREAALIYLDMLKEFAPEISLEQVNKFRELLLTHNLYFSRYLHITEEEFGKLTQKGRRSLLQGSLGRVWLVSEERDHKDFEELKLPDRLRGFEEKARKLKSIELVSLAAIRNNERLIGYQAWYKAEVDGQPVRFDFYFDNELKPLHQEIQLVHLKI